MPHDKNGVEIKAGDVVKWPADEYIPHEKIGVVIEVCKGAETCNLSVDYLGKKAQTEHQESVAQLFKGQSVTAKTVEKIA